MTSMFDRLNAELGPDEPSGISPLDIAELPPDQRHLMLSLLRDQAGTTDGIARDVLEAKMAGRVDDLDGALDELTRSGWLIALGEAPAQRYRVNLRAKRGSNAGMGLWSVLSDRVPKDRPT